MLRESINAASLLPRACSDDESLTGMCYRGSAMRHHQTGKYGLSSPSKRNTLLYVRKSADATKPLASLLSGITMQGYFCVHISQKTFDASSYRSYRRVPPGQHERQSANVDGQKCFARFSLLFSKVQQKVNGRPAVDAGVVAWRFDLKSAENATGITFCPHAMLVCRTHSMPLAR